MEPKQVEHFVAVAKERHFARPVRRLRIGQSALSAGSS
jgi:DNA-binding transcriptional LysR family regulator